MNKTEMERQLERIQLSGDIITSDSIVNAMEADLAAKENPFPTVYEDKPSSEIQDGSDKVEDYIAMRTMLYGLAEQTQMLLNLALKVANENEHPRSMDTAAGLIGKMTDLATRIAKLNVDINKQGKTVIREQHNTQNNYEIDGVTVAKTSDLSAALAGLDVGNNVDNDNEREINETSKEG